MSLVSVHVSRKTKSKARLAAEEAAARIKEEKLARAVLYAETCANRYKADRRKYNRWFLKTLEDVEALQPNAFMGVQVSRYFTQGVLKKYCFIKDPLTPKQRQRVEFMLEN